MKQVMSGNLESSKDRFREIPKNKISPSVFNRIKKMVKKQLLNKKL